MFEDQLIEAFDFDDDRELVEILDARLELASAHQVDRHRESVAARGVEKDILNVGRSDRRRGPGLRYLHSIYVQSGISLQSGIS
jgi:hypothetical protein